MSDVLYWFLFAILVSLLVMFASYLLIRIIRNYLEKSNGDIKRKAPSLSESMGEYTITFTDGDIQKDNEDLEGDIESEGVFEPTNPRSLETLNSLLDVEKRVKLVENEAILFAGGRKNLRYYDINEQFIKLMIELCDIKCDESELRDRKKRIMLHIERCQNVLKFKCC
ncbi:unnamed protein product [Phyllotreta striolata]|uniref:Uncharacterized protein n=1 Tax=Phyllotreta striolata TaxID=444603 RepID=A0A9N9TN45_PHYSR|nr:unnamed protein product [Phyllotreta striolata]